jgi:hypothetical protein
MRFTKKMIMVPEAEYLTLLGMLKAAPGGHLQAEKTQTDADLRRVLADPKLSAQVKAGKYGVLQRKRQQLKAAIEGRPQKVVIENPGAKAAAQADIPPYMAHDPQQNPLEAPSAYETVAEEWGGEQQKSPMRMRRRRGTPPTHGSPFKAIINPRYGEALKNFVAKNRGKFHIHEDGRFDMNVTGKPVKESDYRQVLDYMLGEREGMPRGFKFLMTRLGKDPEVRKFMDESKVSSSSKSGATTNSSYSSQSGEGKRRRRVHIVANAPSTIIKAAKTRGLSRTTNSNKFRPTLWAKLEA